MPFSCFSYRADVPVGSANRDVARVTPRGPRGVGYPCFSYYPDGVPPDNGNRDGAQPTSPELRGMPNTCFRY
jgi:hypothetical protein